MFVCTLRSVLQSTCVHFFSFFFSLMASLRIHSSAAVAGNLYIAFETSRSSDDALVVTLTLMQPKFIFH